MSSNSPVRPTPPVMPTPSDLHKLAEMYAQRYGLFEHIVKGIVEQESNWDPWAVRYEPEFEARYVDWKILTPTERKLRSCSWGLMQVMGQTAYEDGYRGNLLLLIDPDLGLAWGCQVFAHKLQHAEGNYERALLLWNGGGNKDYPAEVIVKAGKYLPDAPVEP